MAIKMYFIFFILLITSSFIFGQNLKEQIQHKIDNLLSSPDAISANLSIYISDENGNLIFDYQGNKGLTSASTQKIFSAGMALAELGKDYQYTTSGTFSGNIENDTLSGDIFIYSNGDPTLGSWRYEGFQPQDFKKKLIQSITEKKIKHISGDIILDDTYFDLQHIPNGWAWEDLGSYYGAGVWGINWRENQFDISIKNYEIQKVNIPLQLQWISNLKTNETTDESIIYSSPYSNFAYISGKIPNKLIKISGANPNPPQTLGEEIKAWLKENNISLSGNILSNNYHIIKGLPIKNYQKENLLFTYKSPTLDKIIYWFMKKSINLYGETLIRTIAKEKTGDGSFLSAVEYLKNFWKSKGISPQSINFRDGSGLSVKNYISAKAEVQTLLWIKQQDWAKYFIDSLPIQKNGMKMKSGTMSQIKSFAGYHNGYVFAVIINNYQGKNISDELFKILSPLNN